MDNSILNAFCDYLNVTVPYDRSGGLLDDLLDACRPVAVAEAVGMEDVWRIGADSGTLLVKRRGPVMICGLSGTAIAALRQEGESWRSVLSALEALPHNVTRLDAAYDVRTHAPPVLWEIYQRSRPSRGLRLGRTRSKVQLAYWGPGSTGEDTGTVRIGTRQSELKARIYDKRQERIDAKFPDPGPWLRYEITLSAAHRLSLEDAWDPTAVFWHFACPALLKPPEGIVLPWWRPGGEGFTCGPRTERTPLERLERYLETSRLVELAAACGAYGAQAVLAWLNERLPAQRQDTPIPSLEIRPAAYNCRPTYAEFRRARKAAGW